MCASPVIENKVLQLILLSYDVSPSVAREYVKRNVLPRYKNEFKDFLKDNDIKHKLGHLHYNDTPCCACPQRPSLRGKRVLNEQQFDILYSYTGKPHETRNPKNQSQITQYCFCFLDPVASLNDLDLSLIWILLHNCCQNVPGISFVKDLKEIRNYVCHLNSFDKLSEDEVDNYIGDIQRVMTSLSVYITPGKVYQDLVLKQTQYIKMGTFKAADVHRLISEGARQQTENTLKILQSFDETAKALKEHTTTLAGNIITKGDANTDTIVGKVRESTDHLKDTVVECHNTETLQLESIQESQEILVETQMVQCENIEKIDEIATDTYRQQNEQTKMITKINEEMTVFEDISDRVASKDDMERFVEFSERVEIVGKGKSFLSTSNGLIETETQTVMREYHDTCTQTGVECLTFELGKRSTSQLKDELLGEENLNNTELKKFLMKAEGQRREKQDKMLQDLQHDISAVGNSVKDITGSHREDTEWFTFHLKAMLLGDENYDNTKLKNFLEQSRGQTTEKLNDMQRDFKNDVSKIENSIADITQSHREETERSTSQLKHVLLGEENVNNTELKYILMEAKNQRLEKENETLQDIKQDVMTIRNTVSDVVQSYREETASQKEFIDSTKKEITESNSINQNIMHETVSNVLAKLDQISERRERNEKDIQKLQATMSDSLATHIADINNSVIELKCCLDESFMDIKQKMEVTTKKRDLEALDTTLQAHTKLTKSLDENVTSSNKNVHAKVVELYSCQAQINEDIIQMIKDIGRKINEQRGCKPQQQRDLLELERIVKENTDLKSQIHRLKEDSLTTLLETAGYTKEEEKVEFNTQMLDGIKEELHDETQENSFILFPKVVWLLALIYQEWLKKEDENYPSIYYVKEGKSIFLVDHCMTCRDHFTLIGINMEKISMIAENLWSTLERFMSLIKSEPFQLLLEEVHNVTKSICNEWGDIEDLATENRKRASVFEQEINKFIQSDVWMESLTDIAKSCTGIFRFLSFFENTISSICSKKSELNSKSHLAVTSKCPKYQYLMTDIMCKEVCHLFKKVTVVKFVTSCYKEISDKHVLLAIQTLDKVISKPKEECLRMNLNILKCNEGAVADIVTSQRKRLMKCLLEIF